MADNSNKGATDAPKNAAETRERATDSGIYTQSEQDKGKTGPGGTGASGATGSTGAKLGDGNQATEASAGTSAQ